jgi:hypothetical protein
VSARNTTVTLWKKRWGVKVECLRCDYAALRGLPSDGIRAAREHAKETGHELNVAQVLNCAVSGGALRLVAPAVEPNPHEQAVWDARTAS